MLTTCGVDLDVLRAQLTEVLAKAFTPVPAPTAVEPEPTLGFDRVIQQAMVHAAVVEREAGRQRQPARVPAAGGRQPRRVLPARAGRRSADAAARDLAWRRRASRRRADRRASRGAAVDRSARGLCDRSRCARRRGADRSADRPRARARAHDPGAVPAPEEQPAAGRRARRRQDRAGRRARAAHSPGRGAGRR